MIKRGRNKLYRFLRWSEQYTKTDMLYLTKGGSWLTFGQSIAAISGLILAVGFAHLLSKEVYGNYQFILSLAGIIGAFTLTGMGTAVTQSVARGFEGDLHVGFKTQLRWSTLMILVSFSVALYYFINGNNAIAISLIIVGIFSPLLTATSLYGSFLTGKKEFKTNVAYNTLRNSIPIAILLFTLFFTDNVIFLIFIYFLSNTATGLFFYLRTTKKYAPTKTTDPTSLHYSKHLSVINVLGIVGSHIDKIFVFHYLGAAQLAVYTFALMAPTQLNGILKNLSVLAFPKFAAQEKSALKKTLLRKTAKILLVSFFMAGVYITVAPLFFHFFFPQYVESTFYSQVFSINIILTGSLLAIATFVQSHKLIKEAYVINVFHQMLKIVLMFFLISHYGIMGIILSILFARFFTLILSVILMVRYR